MKRLHKQLYNFTTNFISISQKMLCCFTRLRSEHFDSDSASDAPDAGSMSESELTDIKFSE